MGGESDILFLAGEYWRPSCWYGGSRGRYWLPPLPLTKVLFSVRKLFVLLAQEAIFSLFMICPRSFNNRIKLWPFLNGKIINSADTLYLIA